MAFALTDLKLRSDVDKGFVAPSTDLKLRSNADKDDAVAPQSPVTVGTNF